MDANEGTRELVGPEGKRGVTIDEAYDLAGGHGCYQVIIAVSVCITALGSMLYLVSIPLFQVFPVVLGCPAGVCPDKEEACKYKYEYKDVHYNFVTEFDLLCDELKGSMIGAIFSIGFCGGILLFGVIGDMCGRLAVLLSGQAGVTVCMGILIVYPNYVLCLVGTCICGFFASGLWSPSFTFAYDSNNTRHIPFYATYINVAFTIGELIICFVVWTGLSWRYVCTLWIAITTSFFFLALAITESPRFLYSKGRTEAAWRSLRYMARVNGKELPEDLRLEEKSKLESQVVSLKAKCKLLLQGWLLFRLLLCSVAFFTGGFVFYGLTMNVQRFIGNVYVNAIGNGLAELLGNVLSGLLYSRLGKRLTVGGMYLMAGICLLLQYIFSDSVVVSSVFMYCGKFAISGGFNLIYAYVGELFPIATKNTVIAVGVLSARVAAALAPLAGIVPLVLFLVSGVLCIASTFAAWLTPI